MSTSTETMDTHLLNSSTLTPEKFDGQFQENPQTSWWKRLTTYLTARQIKDAEAVNLVPLFLKDKALSWYNSLPSQITSDLTLLGSAFQNRFEPHQTHKWQLWDQLEARQQQPGEPIENYISDIQELAKRLSCDDTYTMQKIIRGLSPHVKPLVIQREPTNLTETISYARTLQHTAVDTASTTNTKDAIADALQPLTDQLQRLKLDINTALNSNVHMATSDAHYPRAPRSPSPWRPRRDQQSSCTSSRSPTPTGRNRHVQYVMVQANPSSRRTYPRQRHFNNRPRQNERSFNRRRSCAGCGRQCPTRRQCPAWTLTCHKCNKVGHYASVCRGRE